MKKKTGFTLIELLAVIIILAIIALIATPIVLNVVEESKETARRSSIAGYASGVRYAAYDSGFVLTGKYPEVTKDWAEANVEVSGDTVDCEEVKYSGTYETVLHKCRVGKSEKEYCFAGGKTYEDCENAEYKAIYDSLGNVAVSGKPLVEELLKQYNETNTVGLLKDDTGYYYKGTNEEVNNNFVWFGGHLWRVISIDNDNNLTMITQQPITAIDSGKWTTEQDYETGYINTWLHEVFLTNMEESDKVKIQDDVFTIAVGSNAAYVTTTQKIGLLQQAQYYKAGDTNSFLNIKNQFLLGYRFSVSDLLMFVTESDIYEKSTTIAGIRPVIKISNLTFTDGNGTLDNPYREKSVTTNIAQIKVGEYISVPTSGNDCGEDKKCLFRVVSKDNDSIKVILNGLLPNISTFDLDGDSVYTNANAIDTVLTTFANTIDNAYRYVGNKTFHIGTYGDNTNYTSVQDTIYSGNIGLPVIGEMFTSNDISMDSNKAFINTNTVENLKVAYWFWTMNAYDSSNIRAMVSDGTLMNVSTSGWYGVRPVLFLNNNLNFTSGEGTAENPFMLGE